MVSVSERPPINKKIDRNSFTISIFSIQIKRSEIIKSYSYLQAQLWVNIMSRPSRMRPERKPS